MKRQSADFNNEKKNLIQLLRNAVSNNEQMVLISEKQQSQLERYSKIIKRNNNLLLAAFLISFFRNELELILMSIINYFQYILDLGSNLSDEAKFNYYFIVPFGLIFTFITSVITFLYGKRK